MVGLTGGVSGLRALRGFNTRPTTSWAWGKPDPQHQLTRERMALFGFTDLLYG
jgi:hypothetical protein